jgi:hypothetical protein
MIILEEWGHSVSDIFQILSKKERKRVGSQGRGQWKGYALFFLKKKKPLVAPALSFVNLTLQGSCPWDFFLLSSDFI